MSISVCRIAAWAFAMCACRTAVVRSPPAAMPAPPAADARPADAAPADGPSCEPGVYRFECDVIEGELTHPDGIVD